jgi:hypothetical protein
VLLGLGDSYGCAGGYEKNFFSVFQRRIQAEGHPDALVNLSVPGFQPVDELEMLQRYGPRFHPDVVIQAFFVGNDTDQPPPGRPSWNGNGVSLYLLPFDLFHPDTWAFPTLTERTITFWQQRRRSAEELGLSLAELVATNSMGKLNHPYSVPAAAYHRILLRQLQHFRKDFGSSRNWQQTRRVMTEMVRLSKEAGSRYVLIALPDQLQVEDGYQNELFSDPWIKRDDYDFTIVQKLLRSFAEEQGIAFIDLYPEFKKAGRKGGLYLFQNTHWNDAGNQLAGDLTADAFLRSGLLSHGTSKPTRSMARTSSGPAKER